MAPADSRSQLGAFLRPELGEPVDAPNGRFWFHHLPLADGRRIRGVSKDPLRERLLWRSTPLAMPGALDGLRVLDIGANDGWFTIASLLAGAREVVAVNPADVVGGAYPANLEWGAEHWGVAPTVRTGSFEELDDVGRFDVVLCLGVLYHVERLFDAMRALRRLLAPGGLLVVETQLTKARSLLPVFEMASDSYQSTVPLMKWELDRPGNVNTWIPNLRGLRNLAHAFDLTCTPVPRASPYRRRHGGRMRRGLFLCFHQADRPDLALTRRRRAPDQPAPPG